PPRSRPPLRMRTSMLTTEALTFSAAVATLREYESSSSESSAGLIRDGAAALGRDSSSTRRRVALISGFLQWSDCNHDFPERSDIVSTRLEARHRYGNRDS